MRRVGSLLTIFPILSSSSNPAYLAASPSARAGASGLAVPPLLRPSTGSPLRRAGRHRKANDSGGISRPFHPAAVRKSIACRSGSCTFSEKGQAGATAAAATATRNISQAMSSTSGVTEAGKVSGDVSSTTLPMFLERSRRRALGEFSMRPTSSKTGKVTLHAVSGNEACDADSICSAIALAFLKSNAAIGSRSSTSPQGESGDTSAAAVVEYVPVMPIPRADLALRREVLVLFDMCGIDSGHVIFIDEIDLPALQAKGSLQLTLTDHNAVSGNLASLGDSVVEIVDHHIDLGKHTRVGGEMRDIAFDEQSGPGKPLVGSCCTMVAERMLEYAPDTLTSDVSRLLLGAILIDTINLDKEAKRATERDIAASRELERRISWSTSESRKTSADVFTERSADGLAQQNPPGETPTNLCSSAPSGGADAMFNVLRNAKFDPQFWKELSAMDCLRYDYKEFAIPHQEQAESLPKAFGMSSFLGSLKTLEEKEGAGDAIRTYASQQKIDSLAVISSVLGPDDKMQKELLFYSDKEDRRNRIREFLEGQEGAFMDLQALSPSVDGAGGGEFCSGEGWFLMWRLGNSTPSRKQIAPTISAFYRST